MDAGDELGVLVTRPVRFRGKYLFVNVDTPKGILKVDVLDDEGKVIEPFTADNCDPITADTTLRQVTWKGGKDLSALAGQPARLRFHLKNGSLYAFWISPSGSGASYGYVAGGGPGFVGTRDTVGRRAYQP
jgi:hypothetical protein